jgi:YVTN family beta-propeller protein/probable HAF family extracellular repeat protein
MLVHGQLDARSLILIKQPITHRLSNSAGASAAGLLLVVGSLIATAPAHSEPFAYVANNVSNTISVIDTASNTVTATVAVGSGPRGVAITPNGVHAYVTNVSSNTVSVIDTDTNTVTATVAVGGSPVSVVITPDGARAYVTNAFSDTISVIDTATNAVIENVPVGDGPGDVAITPAGARAYVTNEFSNTVSVIDIATNVVIENVPVGSGFSSVAITPDGAYAYVTSVHSNTVSVIDTASNTVAATVAVGSVPRGVSITPDGAYAYVTNVGSNTVSVLAIASNTVAATVAVGSGPFGIAITADGARAYVTSVNSNIVSVIDTAGNTVAETVTVGNVPLGVAITPPSPKYHLTDLGTLGGSYSDGMDLNDSGQVTGVSATANGEDRAFLWNGITIQDLGTLGGTVSAGWAINSTGMITGYSGTTDGEVHAFLHDGTLMEDLGTFGGTESYGYAINDSGWVTGGATNADGDQRAFLWDGIDLLDLGTLEHSDDSEGLAINESGWVAGRTNAEQRAFIWNGASMLDLGTFGGASSEALYINDSGWAAGSAESNHEVNVAFLWNGVTKINLQGLAGESISKGINASGLVVGESETAAGKRGWVWDGSIVPLGTLQGLEETEPWDINDAGAVTGYANSPSGSDSRAFIWNGVAIKDLNDMVDPDNPLQPFVTLSGGIRINNHGQVLAGGTDSRTGEFHAYLVTPFNLDLDGDGVPYGDDNCPTLSNPDQLDSDSDGRGNACEIPDDLTPPVIHVGVSGSLGNGGWYVSDVQIDWTVSDSESAISVSTGCIATSITTDTADATFTCSATSDGGTSTESVTIKRDATVPIVNIVTPANGTQYEVGTVVVASYDCLDVGAGLRTCEGSVTNGSPISTESIGPKSFVVDMTDHAGNSATVTRNYSVTATSASSFTLSPSALTFPAQAINVPSTSQDLTLTNTSLVAVPITNITRTGTNANQFSHTHNCGTSVASGASCQIIIVFRPTSAGTKSATLNVNAGAGAGTKTVALSGIGAAATYTLTPPPETLAFGDQALNIPSDPRSVTLANTGSVALPITNINDTGTNANQFTETHNCGTTVPIGASCTIEVVFRPTSVGEKLASVRVNAGGGAGVRTIAVSGTGIAPAYTMTPASLSYGSQAVSVASSAQVITLTNTGSLALPITNIARTGTNANQFAHSHDCGTSVAIGAACTISVTFRPTTAGAKVAAIRVNGGAGAGVQSVPLDGTGVVPSFSIGPTTLAFGTQLRNTSSAPQSVTVTNTGSVQLPITSITLTGTNPGQFLRTSNCVSPIAVGGSCTIDVVFRPTSVGTKTANLNVNAGGGGGTQTITLSGTGT